MTTLPPSLARNDGAREIEKPRQAGLLVRRVCKRTDYTGVCGFGQSGREGDGSGVSVCAWCGRSRIRGPGDAVARGLGWRLGRCSSVVGHGKHSQVSRAQAITREKPAPSLYLRRQGESLRAPRLRQRDCVPSARGGSAPERSGLRPFRYDPLRSLEQSRLSAQARGN
jgi:hypothetical protein